MRNSLIPLHSSSNFILSLSNHPGSGTISFSNPICLFYTFTGTINILSIYSVVSSKTVSLVILNNLNCSDSASISCSQCWSILLSINYATSVVYLLIVKNHVHSLANLFNSLTVMIFQWPNYYALFFCKISLVMLYQIL